VIGITCLVVIFWWSLYRTITAQTTSQDNLGQLHQDLELTTSRVQSLEQELQTARNDVTKEKIVRNELLQQKPGEYVVKADLSPAKKTSTPARKQLTAWEEWWQLLR
jgi:hypothetical protein